MNTLLIERQREGERDVERKEAHREAQLPLAGQSMVALDGGWRW